MAAPSASQLAGVAGTSAPSGALTPAQLAGVGTTPAAAPAKTGGGGGGILGSIAKYSGAQFVGNLAKDVGSTLTALPGGLVKLGGAIGSEAIHGHTGLISGHPLRGALGQQIVEPTIQQYKSYYGHDVLGHLYQHPLQPILDALTIADLGSSAAVTAARVAGRAGLEGGAVAKVAAAGERAPIVTRSPRAIATGKGPVTTDISATKPIVKVRQVAAGKVRAKYPEGIAGVGGEVKRYGKQIQQQATQHAMSHLAGYPDYVQATRRLSPQEWAALHIRAMDIHPGELQALWKGTRAEPIINDPVVQKLALEPTPKLLKAEDAARSLSAQGEALMKQKGLLQEEAATRRPNLTKAQASEALGRPVRTISGGDVAPYKASGFEGVGSVPDLAREPGYLYHRTTSESLANIREKGLLPFTAQGDVSGVYFGDEPLQAKGLSWKTADNAYVRVARSSVRDLSERAFGESMTPHAIPPHNLEYLGEDGRWHPAVRQDGAYYFPHAAEPVKSASPLEARGGGKAMPLKPGTMKMNTGELALKGKLNLRSDVLGPEFLRRVKYVKYDEIHNALVRGAIRVTKQQIEDRYGGRLPAGYEYVREKASTRIPPEIRGQGETRTPISQLIPNPEDLQESRLAQEGFTTTDAAQAHAPRGVYHIVPSATAKAATGEFTRSSSFVNTFVRQPLKVWRALVLGTRVGFLTNNLVGNSLMYAVRTGGQGAIRDLFKAVLETHGRETALKLLRNQATPPGIRTDLYKEFFPEQIGGTFGRTQSPSTSVLHVAGERTAEGFRAATGAIPRLTSKVAEEYPRRALIRNFMRHSPEFKRVYGQLPRQTRTFENAARQVLEGAGGPEYQRFISRQVNAALGDYLQLSRAERDVLRNALPFYSWYRAIVTVTLHLAADTPLRANVLGQLGRIGQEQAQSEFPGGLPSFLQGSVGLGRGPQGTQALLSTQGLNPWATLGQLQRGSTSDIGSLGLNPFLIGPMQAYAQAAQQQHTPLPRLSPGALIGATGKQIVQGLPPGQLLWPPKPSKLYPHRTRTDVLLGQLGFPRKFINPAVAAQQAQKGR